MRYVHIFCFCGSPSSVSFAFVCCGLQAALTLCACRSPSSLGFFRTYGEQAPCTAWCEIFARGCHDIAVGLPCHTYAGSLTRFFTCSQVEAGQQRREQQVRVLALQATVGRGYQCMELVEGVTKLWENVFDHGSSETHDS